jgi:hypothetical protein
MILSDLATMVQVEAPGTTEAEALIATYESARDFCRTTGVWKTKATAFTIVTATFTYAIASGSVVSRVVEMRDSNDGVIDPNTYKVTSNGTTNTVEFFDADTMPVAGTSIVAEVELEPGQYYDGDMDGAAWRYQRALISGAVYKFASDAKHPAYNPPKAAECLYQVSRGMSSATQERMCNGHRGSLKMQGENWL